MSELRKKILQIDDMLRSGMDIDDIAAIVDVPVNWVVQIELDLLGLNPQGYEDDYAPPYTG